MGMLSAAEVALLYWLGRDYYTGAGRIVDGGCFMGGSTVALARGLVDGGVWRGGERPIDVYDQFLTDAFMAESYFAPAGLPYGVDESFRSLFERQYPRAGLPPEGARG